MFSLFVFIDANAIISQKFYLSIVFFKKIEKICKFLQYFVIYDDFVNFFDV